MDMKTIFYLFFLSTLSWGGYRLVAKFQAQSAYLGYLKNASQTDSIPLIKIELKKAMVEIERRGLTSGYTSIIWTTPNDNIGLWYKNLMLLLNQLYYFPDNSSAKEKSKMLMKIKEILIDESKDEKDNLYFPEKVYLFPHNKIVALWGAVSIMMTIIFFFLSAKKFCWYKE